MRSRCRVIDVASHKLWIIPVETNGNLFFFFSKYSVQAGRGGDDRKPLTIESLRKAFDNACVNNDCVRNSYYKYAK